MNSPMLKDTGISLNYLRIKSFTVCTEKIQTFTFCAAVPYNDNITITDP